MDDRVRPMILPVILSGGSGTRLWPLSTPDAPKQFHRLGAAASMLQETARRFVSDGAVQFLPPVVICSEAHAGRVEAQFEEAGLVLGGMVLEPTGRNTAAAAAVAAAIAIRSHPGALVLLVPADHVISDPNAFRAVVARAAPTCAQRIVTFGLSPTAPETGFGYIQQGSLVRDGVYNVARFAEKPDLATATNYIAEGDYLWNAGIFFFDPQLMLSEMRLCCGDILDAAVRSVVGGRHNENTWTLEPRAFGECPSEPLDTAVMERTRLAAVAPCEMGWADIGSWAELWRLSPKDSAGNVVDGDQIVLDSQNCLVRAPGLTVVALGVSDLIIVAEGGRLLVAHKDQSQGLKLAVEKLRARD